MSFQKATTDDKYKKQKHWKHTQTHVAHFSDYIIRACTMPVSSARTEVKTRR